MAGDDKFQQAEYITCKPLIAQPISNCQMIFPISYRAIQSRGESREITGNHFGSQILALFGDQVFCGHMRFH